MTDETLREALERYEYGREFDHQWRYRARDDSEFESGEQWQAALKKDREMDKGGARPCLVMNHARKHVNNSVNAFRASRPQFKVLPQDSNADPETAEMMNGMLRHIQSSSEASIAYDNAAWHQRVIGLGFFRVGTRIASPVTREQEIFVGQIKNPFAVVMDPAAAHPAGMDAQWCLVEEQKNKKTYLKEHPSASEADFESQERSGHWWKTDDKRIRVAEYWTREERKETLVVLETGQI